MRIVLLGPQGAGKGTQGARLAARRGVPHVATGDILRGHVRRRTELGAKAKGYMDRGELVPDDLVTAMLRDRLLQPDAARGFVLDGFPRNSAQAEALKSLLAVVGSSLDAVVSLEADDELLVQRLSKRVTCPTCGRPFHIEDVQCPDDGTPLVQREDDKPDAIRRRLQIFHSRTAPLVAFYEADGCLVRVDGDGSMDEVFERIEKALADR